MKAILKFKLPEENHEFELANKASDVWVTLYDVLQELRSALRHNAGEFKDLDPKTLEAVQKFIYSEAADRKIPDL
jgi:hypothetical protein